MAAGQLLWVIGDAVESWAEETTRVLPFPSTADGFYLAAYPVLALSLVLLIRRRRTKRDVAGLLDSATLTAGLGLLSWVLLARPTLNTSHTSVAAALVAVAYPIADILLAGLLIRLVTTPGGRTMSLRLLLAAVALLIAGDSTSAALSRFTSSDTSNFDVIWLASYIVWGIAALHPSMKSLSEPTTSPDLAFGPGRLAALALATLVAPGTLAVQWLLGKRIDVWAVVTGSVVLFLLVVGRMNVAIEQAGRQPRSRPAAGRPCPPGHARFADDAAQSCPGPAVDRQRVEPGLSHVVGRRPAVHRPPRVQSGQRHLRSPRRRRRAALRRPAVPRRHPRWRHGGAAGRRRVRGPARAAGRDAVGTRGRGTVLAASADIVTTAGDVVRIGASVGVAVSRIGGDEAEHLLHEADVAVYRAKRAGRGRAVIYEALTTPTPR